MWLDSVRKRVVLQWTAPLRHLFSRRAFFFNFSVSSLFQGHGLSDPYAVVTKLSDEGRTLIPIGRTEVVKNSLSPHWVKVFVVDYELGTPFVFAVSVFDEQTSGKSRPMGSAVFELGKILGARGSTKAKYLRGNGTIFAMVRKSTGSGTLRFQFRGEKVSSQQIEFSLHIISRPSHVTLSAIAQKLRRLV